MERALKLTTLVDADGFGVLKDKWLPGFSLFPVLAALRRQIEEKNLGDQERADLRRWYWCNVFLERYSSAVESKSRKDFTEMMAHWLKGGPEPAVFTEANNRINAPNYTVAESASSSSSIYSGVFCLLALNGAKDWTLGETIELQTLQDHHIFPQAYLKRHGYGPQKDKAAINSILNRTLISDQTNNKIKAKAPATYLASTDIFPTGATAALMSPHFLSDAALAVMRQAMETPASAADVQAAYEAFRKAREASIVAEIRRVCGV